MRTSHGNLIGKGSLTDSQFITLISTDERTVEQYIELTTSNGKPVKLQIVFKQMLVSSPRLYFLQAVQERNRYDISQLSPPSNNCSSTDVSVATSVLDVMSSISQLKSVIDRLASVHPYANLAWQILTAIYNVGFLYLFHLFRRIYSLTDHRSPKTARSTRGCSCDFNAECDPLAHNIGSSYQNRVVGNFIYRAI